MSIRVGLRSRIDVEFTDETTEGQAFPWAAKEYLELTPSSGLHARPPTGKAQAGHNAAYRGAFAAPRRAASRERIAYPFFFPGRTQAAGAFRSGGSTQLWHSACCIVAVYRVESSTATSGTERAQFRCFTPGLADPIRAEQELFGDEPDFFLVLPWHFREFFIRNTNRKKAATCNPRFPNGTWCARSD